jgi:uncharacterized protein (DUF486 family)
MRTLGTILMLMASNTFMTMAWYGHLKWKNSVIFQNKFGIWGVIFISWSIAFFEYLLMVPANRLGSKETGGSMSLMQLKVLQEVISIVVFALLVLFLFKGETLSWRHALAFAFIIMAVWLVFDGK